jgi:hypothetical protein
MAAHHHRVTRVRLIWMVDAGDGIEAITLTSIVR